MRRRTIAIASSIAALSLATAPLAAASADQHNSAIPPRPLHQVEKKTEKHSRDGKHIEARSRR